MKRPHADMALFFGIKVARDDLNCFLISETQISYLMQKIIYLIEFSLLSIS